jgi:hypothetical protein
MLNEVRHKAVCFESTSMLVATASYIATSSLKAYTHTMVPTFSYLISDSQGVRHSGMFMSLGADDVRGYTHWQCEMTAALSHISDPSSRLSGELLEIISSRPGDSYTTTQRRAGTTER